jgi:gas vesicle protein
MKFTKILSLVGMFIVGGMIGAGVALLMAPQSGRRTRSKIRDKGVELREKAVETAEDTRHRASHTMDDLATSTKNRFSSLKERSRDLVRA